MVNGVDGKPLEPELFQDLRRIRLCGLRRWKRLVAGAGAGGENARGSDLYFEHFLHFRALVKDESFADFRVPDYVDAKYIDAARRALTGWLDFETYLDNINNYDPTVVLDTLGKFEQVRFSQNQILRNAYLQGHQFRTPQPDDLDDLDTETPIKRRIPSKINYLNPPPGLEAADDEQIVNAAIIGFAQTLTRRSMIRRQTDYDTPTKITGSEYRDIMSEEKIVADWTLKRDRYDIREPVRPEDRITSRPSPRAFRR